MRSGTAPDDSHYVPVFPFLFYNSITDTDLADLWAYLGSLPAESRSDRRAPGSTALLARARAAIAVAATPQPGAWRPDPGRDPVWNRGAYLVHSVGRCGDCHTPRSWIGAPDADRFLAGAATGTKGKGAPNITPAEKGGIGQWSIDDIVGVLTDGHTPDFDFVGGAMAEAVKNTGRMTPDDRRAIAVFLKSVRPIETPDRK